MSSKSSIASRRSRGASSNTGERSVRQSEYAVRREAVKDRLHAMPVWPRTGGGSKRLKTIPSRTGGGSKKLRTCSGTFEMCWMASDQDADEPNGDQGQQSGAAFARGSMSGKLWLNERITAWKKTNLRAFWIICGEKPTLCDLSRV